MSGFSPVRSTAHKDVLPQRSPSLLTSVVTSVRQIEIVGRIYSQLQLLSK